MIGRNRGEAELLRTSRYFEQVLGLDLLPIDLHSSAFRFLGIQMKMGARRRPEIGLFSQWIDHHNHLAAFHFGNRIDLPKLFDINCNTFQQFTPKVQVGHFAATKP